MAETFEAAWARYVQVRPLLSEGGVEYKAGLAMWAAGRRAGLEEAAELFEKGGPVTTALKFRHLEPSSYARAIRALAEEE